MPKMILDPELAERLKAERALSGADRYDEVWEETNDSNHSAPLTSDTTDVTFELRSG